MRIIHVSHSLQGGGAAIAADRILKVASSEHVSLATDRSSSPAIRTAMTLPIRLSLRLQKSCNPVHRSINVLSRTHFSAQWPTMFDVAHLHWVGDDQLSISGLGRLSKLMPVVWTLHDTWAFTGADHHPKDEADVRYRVGYTRESRLHEDGRIDVDACVFRRKMRAWKSPMWLVAPSSHVMRMAQESALASSWPVTVIPNPVDCEVFTAVSSPERVGLRRKLGVEGAEPIILFGSGLRAAHTKGMDLLEGSLQELRNRSPHARFITFGPESNELPNWVDQIGFVADESSLRNLYAAADVVLVPSRFETFSQVAAEAQACGTPVAAFATSGLLDVVSEGETGFLAKGFDPLALADAAEQVIAAGEPMRQAARERAERMWAMPVVGKQYADWYEQAIREFRERQEAR